MFRDVVADSTAWSKAFETWDARPAYAYIVISVPARVGSMKAYFASNAYELREAIGLAVSGLDELDARLIYGLAETGEGRTVVAEVMLLANSVGSGVA